MNPSASEYAELHLPVHRLTDIFVLLDVCFVPLADDTVQFITKEDK